MGLAIVKRIVERHGGSVLCDKSDLGGARFTLSLATLDEDKDKDKDKHKYTHHV